MWETITVYIKYSHVDLLVRVEYEWQSLVKSLLELSTLFIWGIPDTERRGACMRVDIPVSLGIAHSFGGRQVFWGYPDIRAKSLKRFFIGEEMIHSSLLPPLWNSFQQNYSLFRAEEFETKRMVLCHGMAQSVHTLTRLRLEPSRFYLLPSWKPDPETTTCLQA